MGIRTSFDIDQLNMLKEELPASCEILYQYQGIFSKEKIKEFLNKISENAEGFLTAQKKLYYVLIELAQNVNKYSNWRENNDGVGSFILGKTETNFFFLMGNIISNQALQVLLKKCDIINSLDRESLRLFKRQQRNLIPGTNRGAHIGLIMIALTTKKPLDIRIKQIDSDYSYFIINVEIEKT